MRLKQYVCKSPYPYYVVQSDIELTKFDVWTNTKLFNAWLHTEEEVVAMIEAKYPGSQRIARSHRPRQVFAQALTRRKPYPVKQSLTLACSCPKIPQNPACVVEFPRVCPPAAQI